MRELNPIKYVPCTFDGLTTRAAAATPLSGSAFSLLCWYRYQHTGPGGYVIWLGMSGSGTQHYRIQALTTGRFRLSRYSASQTTTDSPSENRANRGSKWVLYHGVVDTTFGQSGHNGLSFSTPTTTSRVVAYDTLVLGSDEGATIGNYVSRTVYMLSPMIFNTMLNESEIRRIYMGEDPRNVKGEYLAHWYPDLTTRSDGTIKDRGWAKTDLTSSLIPLTGASGQVPIQLIKSKWQRRVFSTAPATLPSDTRGSFLSFMW